MSYGLNKIQNKHEIEGSQHHNNVNVSKNVGGYLHDFSIFFAIGSQLIFYELIHSQKWSK